MKRAIIVAAFLVFCCGRSQAQSCQTEPPKAQVELSQSVMLLAQQIQAQRAEIAAQRQEIAALTKLITPKHHRKGVRILLAILPIIDHAGSVASIYSIIPH